MNIIFILSLIVKMIHLSINDLLFPYSQEVCMPYAVHKIPGLNFKICHFPVMYQTQNFCQTINNILFCTIQNPQYSLAQ